MSPKESYSLEIKSRRVSKRRREDEQSIAPSKKTAGVPLSTQVLALRGTRDTSFRENLNSHHRPVVEIIEDDGVIDLTSDHEDNPRSDDRWDDSPTSNRRRESGFTSNKKINPRMSINLYKKNRTSSTNSRSMVNLSSGNLNNGSMDTKINCVGAQSTIAINDEDVKISKAQKETPRKSISASTMVNSKSKLGLLAKLTSAGKRTEAILNDSSINLDKDVKLGKISYSRRTCVPPKPSLKSIPKYSVKDIPNPSLIVTSSYMQHRLEKRAEFKNDSKLSRCVEFDFGSDESHELGHRYTIDKFKNKDLDLKRRDVEGKISFTKAYHDSLLEAFGIKYILTSEFIENEDDVDPKYAGLLKDHKINHDVFAYVRQSLKPNLARALDLLSIDPSLVNIAVPGKIDHEYGGMTIIFAALWYSDIQTFIHLLQIGANTRHKDNKKKKVREYISKHSLRSDGDLRLKRNILTLFDEAIKVIDMSSIIKDWRRIQLQINGIWNFKLHQKSKSSPIPKTVFCSVSLDGQRQSAKSNDGTNHKSTTQYNIKLDSDLTFLDMKRSNPYELLLNKSSNRFSQYLVKVEIIMGHPGKGETKGKELALLSSWSCKSNELLDVATVEGIEGRFELEPAPGSLIMDGAQLELGEYCFVIKETRI